MTQFFFFLHFTHWCGTLKKWRTQWWNIRQYISRRFHGIWKNYDFFGIVHRHAAELNLGLLLFLQFILLELFLPAFSRGLPSFTLPLFACWLLFPSRILLLLHLLWPCCLFIFSSPALLHFFMSHLFLFLHFFFLKFKPQYLPLQYFDFFFLRLPICSHFCHRLNFVGCLTLSNINTIRKQSIWPQCRSFSLFLYVIARSFSREP